MKKLLFIIITMAVCLTISGQQINQSNNRYRSYDVLEKKLVTVKGFDLNSKKGVWVWRMQNSPKVPTKPSTQLRQIR